MIIMHESDAPSLEVEGPYKRTLKVLLSRHLDSAVDSLAAGLTTLPPGCMSDYVHHVEGEMFFIISGEGTMRVEEETVPVKPGDAIWVPTGKTHQMANPGQATMKVLWVLSPPGREVDILKKCGIPCSDPGGGR